MLKSQRTVNIFQVSASVAVKIAPKRSIKKNSGEITIFTEL